MKILFLSVSDDWFLQNHVHHPTMRDNHRYAQSDLTLQVLYFSGQILARSSMRIEDNKKKVVFHKY